MAIKFCLTNKGLEMKARLETGAVLKFTKVETGSAYSLSPEKLTGLLEVSQTLGVNSIDKKNDVATIKVMLNNINNETEYYLRQMGLYVEDPDSREDILYIIGQDQVGERIPAISDMQVEFEFNINIRAGNAEKIEFVIDNEEVNNKIESVKESVETLENKVNLLKAEIITEVSDLLKDSLNGIVQTLTAGNTEIVFHSESITEDSTIDIYTSVFGIAPINAVITSGSITLTFDANEKDIQVKVRWF